MFKHSITAVLFFLGACAAGDDQSAEEARLMQTSRDWSEAMQSRDLDRIMEFYADDAVILSPGEPERRGKAAIRDHLQASFEVPGFAVRWTPVGAQVAASGDLGYLVGLQKATARLNGLGAPVAFDLRITEIYGRQNGVWKMLHRHADQAAPGTQTSAEDIGTEEPG